MPFETSVAILTGGGWIDGLIFEGKIVDMEESIEHDGTLHFKQRLHAAEVIVVVDSNAILARRYLKEKNVGKVEIGSRSVLSSNAKGTPSSPKDDSDTAREETVRGDQRSK